MSVSFSKDMAKRISIILAIIVFLFSLDAFRIFYISVVKGDEYSAKAESQQISDSEIPAKRGSILDCEGNVLAQSATTWDIFLDPSNITDSKRDLIVDGLSDILDLDDEQKNELREKSQENTMYVVVAEQVENDIKEEISAFRAENKVANCIGTEQNTKRYYPYGQFASSVLGFTGDDNQGLYGLELYYDEELKGTNGRIVTVKDAQKNNLPTDYETSVDAVDGNSLVLTINQNIQYTLEKNLKATMNEYQCKGAYGVVMNCKTGGVLAMSSMPDFDCNEPYTLTYEKNINDIEKITDKEEKKSTESTAVQNQWNNFVVSGTYEPGSVFKTFMASAALEEDVVDLNTTYNCTGSIQVEDYRMNCHYHPGHGLQTFAQGLANSCNPFFITVGQKLGVHNYFKYFESFGFTEKTGIDLPGEASPQYYKENQYGIVELSSASFGQSNNLTPIQVCTGLCAIANGGTLVKPYIVDHIVDSNGNTVKKTDTTTVRRVISEETSEQVRTMMKGVVDNGTGKNGYVAGYRVGGKTGTSTKLAESTDGKNKYIVSFGAIAPSDDPEIAMLIIIEEPNEDLGGGALCAPIAAQVTETCMQELNVEPVYDDEEATQLPIDTPNLIGNTLSTAKSTLDSSSLKYKVVGDGDTVVRQSPIFSSKIPTGATVILYTEKVERNTVKVPDFKGMSVSEANAVAAEYDLNIEATGLNIRDSQVVAYRQSIEADSECEAGSVITVAFKNTNSVLD
ncbi:MAG TPA: stage V sporulation protein D [Ruminococcaceae bacterium]|nr:stage V sporulation protein D [Oscillospiraceae bacterium]